MILDKELERIHLMSDKQYLSETILHIIIKKLDEIKQTSDKQIVLNHDILNCLIEQSQQQA